VIPMPDDATRQAGPFAVADSWSRWSNSGEKLPESVGVGAAPKFAVDIESGHGMSPGKETAKGLRKKLSGKVGANPKAASTFTSPGGSSSTKSMSIGRDADDDDGYSVPCTSWNKS